ncbi:MAG: glycoside hydrolase family 88 protein [Spirochaetales bacterium]|nr:glycoside hydrolase family 88 protein [Spirochaetales bacterium]
MTDAVIKNNPVLDKVWSYDYGVLFKGIEMVWKKYHNPDHFFYIKKNMDELVSERGEIFNYSQDEYNIDNINNGKTLLFLYRETGEEKYKKASISLRKQRAVMG